MPPNSMNWGNSSINYDIPELWNAHDDPYSKHLTLENPSEQLDRSSLFRRRIRLIIGLLLALAILIIVVLTNTSGTAGEAIPLPPLPIQSSPPNSAPISLDVTAPVSSPISSSSFISSPVSSSSFSRDKMYQFSFFRVDKNMEYYLQYDHHVPDFLAKVTATVDATATTMWVLDGGASSSSTGYDIWLAPSKGAWVLGVDHALEVTVGTTNKGLYAWQVTPTDDNKYIISSSSSSMEKGCLALDKYGTFLKIDSTGSSSCIAWTLKESASPASFSPEKLDSTEERAKAVSSSSSSLFNHEDVVERAGDMTSTAVSTWRPAKDDEVTVETPLTESLPAVASSVTTMYRISFVDASQVKWYLTYNNNDQISSSRVYIQPDALQYGTLWKLPAQQESQESYQIVAAEADGAPVLGVDAISMQVVADTENSDDSYPWEFMPWPDDEHFDIHYFFSSNLRTGCLTVANNEDDDDTSPSFGIITFDENDCILWNIEASD